MNETIQLMQEHVSVRSFTGESIPEEHLTEILKSGQAASSWKNFQSYSIIKVRKQETKQAIYDLQPQPWILTCDTFLRFLSEICTVQGKLFNCIAPLSIQKGSKIS